MNYQSETSYKLLLKQFFESDSDLINKWHIMAGQGLEACVEKTFNDLQEANVQIFIVYKDAKPVGYFGKESLEGHLFLTGFFLKPELRNRENLSEFWNLINQEIKQPFYCGLYNKNEPAIRFITRNQGKSIYSTQIKGDDCTYFKVGA